MNEPFAPICTYTPTIMSGPVIKWFRTEHDVQYRRSAVVSASRNMVAIDTDVINAEQADALIDTIRAAVVVMYEIRDGHDVKNLATGEVEVKP